LREVEKQYPGDVAVIGVHSGKYIAERDTARIREACLRYDIAHPVVNDRQFRIWRSYAVNAWPTLVVIDRNGYVVGAHAGEFTAERLQPLLENLLSQMTNPPPTALPHFPAEKSAVAPSILRYPGKVARDRDRIAISDTGNHRVIVGALETEDRMRVQHVVSHLDGSDSKASLPSTFSSPQGLAFAGDELYVADSGNHTVCVVNVHTGTARILAGTGRQMRTHADKAEGALSSPWDVVVVGAEVYVAMAGVHQIWALDKHSGRSRVHAGTGGEDLRDGSNASALLAQPMGIAADDTRLYFADAESSAIRWADLDAQGSVGTIIGTGLFDFGDVDGEGDTVRMQHQQGIARRSNGDLLVVDSYNDALKWVNTESRQARVWLRGLHEPGGVAAAEHCAYIADTNAHRIMVADYDTNEIVELEISN
jgi:DNA-binding beta-propeller fold protein YncE